MDIVMILKRTKKELVKKNMIRLLGSLLLPLYYHFYIIYGIILIRGLGIIIIISYI